MNRTLKIFISCALGAGLGTMVALEIHQYFWWVGVIVGGLVGYLSYEFKTVISASCQAYREVVGWRPDKELWKARIKALLWIMLFSVTICIAIAVFWIIFGNRNIPIVFIITVIFVLFTFLLFAIEVIGEENKNRNEILEHWVKNSVIYRKFNPFSFYFYYPLVGIWWCLNKIPSVVMVAGQLIKRVLILIHPEIRLLCGVYAAVGAAIGYFTGYVLIGMIAGGVIGVIHYVVSKCILHIVPSKG